MKEKLHTIPVNEAFDTDCECPVCAMRKALETNAIEFTMGPSYMEDDVRGATSTLGFCDAHAEKLYKHQNRLGLALIIKSHMDKIVKDIERQTEANAKIAVPSLFKKKGEKAEVVTYLDKLSHSCYICEKINGTFERYIATIFHLYHHEQVFRDKFKAAKGFCTAHYNVLYQSAPEFLSGDELKSFIKELDHLYLENMKRVRDELEWFIDKFDYRNADKPWNNSRDALPRALNKTNSITDIK